MEKINQVDEKTALTNAHHKVCEAIQCFSRMSTRIPKVSLEIVQHIYGRFDDALFCIYDAENTYDAEQKAKDLHQAKDDLFFQFTSLEVLVHNHSITVGQANEVIKLLREAHTDVAKWLKSVVCNNSR